MAAVVEAGGGRAKPKTAVVDLESGISNSISHIKTIYFQFCLLMFSALYIYTLLFFSPCSAHCFAEPLRAGLACHSRRCWDHYFYEDFDLASGGTNLIHRRHDIFDNGYGHVDERTVELRTEQLSRSCHRLCNTRRQQIYCWPVPPS